MVDAGVYQLDNGKTLMAGTINNGNPDWTTVSFPDAFPSLPAVFAQCMSTNETSAVSTRIDHSQTTTDQTSLRIREQEGADNLHADETIGWIAIETGAHNTGKIFEVAKTGTVVDENWKTINFSQTYPGNNPLFIAALASFNGGDPSSIRYNASTLSNNGVNLFLEEEDCNDSETGHVNEDVHYLVLDQPGLINGVPKPGSNPDLGIFTSTADIGNVGAAGSAVHFNGNYYLEGSGADIWNTADEFRFIFKPHAKSGEIIARINSVANTNQWAKAGVMFRASSAADSPLALVLQRPDKQVTFQWRTSPGASAQSVSVTGGTSLIKFVRLVRTADQFAAFYSTQSKEGPWTQIGSEVNVAMPDDILAGLALTSHNDGVLTSALFDEVCVIESLGYHATKIRAKVHLQGAFSAMHMTTNLRTSGHVPLVQPYGNSPWNYKGGECVDVIPTDCVDWVLVRIRDAADHHRILGQRACFIRNDGMLIDMNGSDEIDFGVTDLESGYISIHHRNHLGIMSEKAVDLDE